MFIHLLVEAESFKKIIQRVVSVEWLSSNFYNMWSLCGRDAISSAEFVKSQSQLWASPRTWAPSGMTHLPPPHCPSSCCCEEVAPPRLQCPTSPEHSPPRWASPPAAGGAHWWYARISPAFSAEALHNWGGKRLCPCWESLKKLGMCPFPSPC